jgi:hypothetical protein
MLHKPAFLRKTSFRPVIEQLENRELLNATPAQLVTRLYGDLLGRQPDQAGLEFWTNQTDSAAPIVSGLLQTPEALGHFVDSRFQVILGRPADAGAKSFFSMKLQTGLSLVGFDATLYASPEFNASDSSTFVNAVFTTALGRDADPKAQSYFAGLLNGGTTRQEVAQAIAGSSEGLAQIVDGWYQQYLRRPADTAEQLSWVGELAHNANRFMALAGILSSNEYSDSAATGFSTAIIPGPSGTTRPEPLPVIVVAPDMGSAPLVKAYDAETGLLRFQFYA